jgi:hypothetical protein
MNDSNFDFLKGIEMRIVKDKRAVAEIDFMLRQAQHERKSHMISTYPVRPEPVEGQTVGLDNSP